MKQRTCNLKNRSGFTLTEILVVMVIVGILVALLTPVVQEAFIAAEKAKANTETKAIKAAIDAYHSAYGKLPTPTHGVADVYYQASPSSKPIIKALIGEHSTGAGTVPNTRKEVFLDLSTGATDGTFLDPWGNQYGVTLDTDYDNKVQITSLPAPNNFNVLAVVRSLGPNGTADSGSNSDDIWSVDQQ